MSKQEGKINGEVYEYPPPTEYHLSTKDWIANQSFLPWYKEIHESHTRQLKQPKGFDERLHISFSMPEFYSPAPFVVEVPNGRVYGDFGCIIAPDNKLLWDVSIFPPFIPSEHPVFRQATFSPAHYVDETIAVLTFCASSMHYHWIFDVISRIDLLNKSGIPIDRYIVNGVKAGFQWEILEAIGIPKERLIICHETFHLEAKKLIIPAAPAIEWGPHHWQIQYIRQEFMKGNQPNPEFERIYISRSLASHRKVINEDQVLEVLYPLGFKCIHLESLSVAQQIVIMSSAKIVIAPHGSGLTNLIFCQPATKVIELFTSNFPVYVFWLLCNHLDLDYYYLFGEGERSADRIDPKHGYDDMVIDIEKLSRMLLLSEII
ncbi:glycosyltransferase family 61 protein [Cohnella abietis]|uniref:glycosyltransferase family 61 protein n=1 Tax=Cohnella abietis TaxID=2507935 RepID=UPI0011AE54C4|nr:glycosyltransferase family 61 protein [Cohnella abietis]